MTTNHSIQKDQMTAQMKRSLKTAPWVLRVTEHKRRSVPVLVVKERVSPQQVDSTQKMTQSLQNGILQDRGLIHGNSLRRCIPVLRTIVSGICDAEGIPLELHRFFANGRIVFRGNLPLDEEAGAKLALLFKLQERLNDLDRIELIARRIERFSREEAVYWLSRAVHYGAALNRWTQAGMRLMLGGPRGDKSVQSQLERLRG